MRTLVVLVVVALASVVFAGCVTSEDVPNASFDDQGVTGTSAGEMREVPFLSFEPTIGVDSTGAVFLSIFGGGPIGYRHVARSLDGGATWEDVTAKVAGVSFPPNSNDPYIYVDQDTDRLFNFDMHALACMTLSWSDDQGETWTNNPVGCGQPVGGQDHQTFWTSKPRTVSTVGYENVLHYCVNRVADVACAMSIDGGIAWSPLRPVVFEPCIGIGMLTGHGVSGPDGHIYIGKSHCSRPTIAVSEDDGITWQTVRIADVPIDGHDVNMGTDEAGNVYATWRSDNAVVLSLSTDFGRTWSTPLDVSPPEVLMAEFMVVEGGADGRAAVAYYGSEVADGRSELESDSPWNAYLTVVLNATTDPVVETVQLNAEGDPIARGPCDDNNRCRGVGDFIDVVIGADGRPWVALVDTCRGDCIDDPSAGTGGVRGAVGTLSIGLALRGDLVQLPALAPAAHTSGTSTDEPSSTSTSPPHQAG